MRTIEILDQLVSFDTVSAKSNLSIIAYIEDLLSQCGCKITRVPSPCGEKAGLFATLGEGEGGVVLSAHTDVVPVAGQSWTRPAFRMTEDAGRLYGRGTTDMKGFLAAMLSAAERASQGPLSEPLKLSISYDEEVGCVGMAHMIGKAQAALGQPRACIVGEPTDMTVATGHKGKLAFRITCTGQAGHSSLAPRFLNALHLASDTVNVLRDHQEELARAGSRDDAYDIPYSTVHVGRLSGGTALNIVPDKAELLAEIRHLAADDPVHIMANIRQDLQSLAAAHPDGTITVEEFNSYPGLDADGASPTVEWAMEMAGRKQTRKVGFGTEAGYFTGLGVPTVVCGPGSMEGQGHKADEFITRTALADCDRMLDRVLADLQ